MVHFNGYVSPEYALGRMISEKSDIYSFGVLLLEIISGKRRLGLFITTKTHSLISHVSVSKIVQHHLPIILYF